MVRVSPIVTNAVRIDSKPPCVRGGGNTESKRKTSDFATQVSLSLSTLAVQTMSLKS